MRVRVDDGGRWFDTKKKQVNTIFSFLSSFAIFYFSKHFLQSAEGFVCVGQTLVCSFVYVSVKRCYTAQVEKKLLYGFQVYEVNREF